MKGVALLFFIISFICCACDPPITSKQSLSEEKMDAVTALGEGQREASAPDPAADQRSHINQNIISPAPQDRNPQVSPPAAPFALIPAIINQTNIINQGR